MVTQIPFGVKLMIMYQQARRGRTYEEFEGRVAKELPLKQQKLRIKDNQDRIQQKLLAF